jgi:BirA family biotin operon repressor/biotin-[acetyl-CoA-carboxylase] ligase
LQDQPIIGPLGQPFVELQSIDSTNNYALDCIRQSKAGHGAAFYAHEQKAGKGQRGRKWSGEKGANIAISIVLDTKPLAISSQFQLSACIAVATQAFFSLYAGSQVKIKWPNDLYWMDKKAGGILIENIITGNRKRENQQPDGRQLSLEDHNSSSLWKWAVAGIGININQTRFPDDLPNPISLRQITGKSYDAVALARELCEIADVHFRELILEGFDAIYKKYNTSLYKLNETVKLKKKDDTIITTIKGVSAAGQLITHDGNEEVRFGYGDITWLRE